MIPIREWGEWQMIWREGEVKNHVGACPGTENTGLRTMRLYWEFQIRNYIHYTVCIFLRFASFDRVFQLNMNGKEASRCQWCGRLNQSTKLRPEVGICGIHHKGNRWLDRGLEGGVPCHPNLQRQREKGCCCLDRISLFCSFVSMVRKIPAHGSQSERALRSCYGNGCGLALW